MEFGRAFVFWKVTESMCTIVFVSGLVGEQNDHIRNMLDKICDRRIRETPLVEKKKTLEAEVTLIRPKWEEQSYMRCQPTNAQSIIRRNSKAYASGY
jgi:hypothetical protein